MAQYQQNPAQDLDMTNVSFEGAQYVVIDVPVEREIVVDGKRVVTEVHVTPLRISREQFTELYQNFQELQSRTVEHDPLYISDPRK